MDARKSWSYAGLFVIALILSIPFNSASALAISVSVTKNTGQAQIPDFIDGAGGETWALDVAINDLAEDAVVDEEDVKLHIGNQEDEFQSCSSLENGVVSCSYIDVIEYPLPEGAHTFQVSYSYLNDFGVDDQVMSLPMTISVDASSPKINVGSSFKQKPEGEIKGSFTVNELVNVGKPFVGLKQIQIINSENGEIYFISDFVEGTQEFNFLTEGGTEGDLGFTSEEQGQIKIKIMAIDHLNHQSFSGIQNVNYDYLKPEVISDSLVFLNIGEFIGSSEIESDMKVKIIESNDLEKENVKAYSEDADLDGDAADKCERSEEEEDVEDTWICEWENVMVSPGSSLSIKVIAKDKFSNVGEGVLSKSFVEDTVPPSIEFFGTNRVFGGESYINKDDNGNKIVLIIKEEGSGIDANGVRANLLGFGQSNYEEPDLDTDAEDICEQIGDNYVCVWDVEYDQSGANVEFGLSKLEDRTGNAANLIGVEAIVDTGAPKLIEDTLEFKGVSPLGVNKFFQSGDLIRISAELRESTGIFFKVNLNQLVDGAANEYPESELNDAGWALFTEEDCQRKIIDEQEVDDVWECVFETTKIISGPLQSVGLELEITDTAGNKIVDDGWIDAKNVENGGDGEYSFELLGVATEEDPNHWKVKNQNSLIGFVDLDATRLIPTRHPVEINFDSEQSDIEIMKVDLAGCGPLVDEPAEGVPASSSAGETNLVQSNLGEESTENEETQTEEVEGVQHPSLLRSFIYDSGENQVSLVLEFQPFDGKDLLKIGPDGEEEEFTEMILKYECGLNIYSRVDEEVLSNYELQEIEIPVSFAFSKLGAVDENLESKIKSLQDGWYDTLTVLSNIAVIFEWINYIVRIIQIIDSAMIAYNALTAGSDALRSVPSVGPALASSVCGITDQAKKEAEGAIRNWLEPTISVLTCAGGSKGFAGHFSSISAWRDGVLKFYNLWSLRDKLGLPAKSLYENIIVSSLGICIPGILHNLEKLRQVQCRYMHCLRNEVPQGIATVDSCAKLDNYLTCIYWSGQIYTAIPFLDIWDNIIDILAGWFKSPASFIRVALMATCLISCSYSGTASSVCWWTDIIISIADVIEGVIGVVEQRPDLQGNPWCAPFDKESDYAWFY